AHVKRGLAVVFSGAEQIASALERTAIRDLDPFAVLVVLAAERERGPLAFGPLAEHLHLRRSGWAHRSRSLLGEDPRPRRQKCGHRGYRFSCHRSSPEKQHPGGGPMSH